MTWISLASNRYKLREILEHDYSNTQNKEMRLEVIDSLRGLYSLLSGDEFYIKSEIEIAEFLVSNYIKKTAPPYEILSDVMGLVIIADLGETDYTEVFESISKSKSYKQDFQKSLQLIARQLSGIEKYSNKNRKKKGHVSSEKSWLRLVNKYNPEQAFSLAVTLDHPNSFMLKKFILPLAFLLSKNQIKEDRRNYFRRILSWGQSNIEEQKNIVYERMNNPATFEKKLNYINEIASYGFDALELKDEEVVAYYYFGENRQTSELFKNEKYVYHFFENLLYDWSSIKNSIETKIWNQIKKIREENKCCYTFVYDFENVHLPEKIIKKAADSFGLNVVIKDITEV